ncbi:MAG: DOMON domain-containing protein [Spirochaetales bacterium]|jgi:hypothetical protein|nr:DOMON domain-containing protein [Spirochaetales bacterium]
MKKTFTMITLVLLTAAIAFAGGDEEEASESMVLPGYSQAGNDSHSFDFQWQVDGDSLNVQIMAPTTGWIALGFDPSNKMADANILIGYVADGKAFLRDDYGIGQVKHGPDTAEGGEENFSNLDGGEADGGTMLSFTIMLDSGDAYDKVLEEGKTYKIIYAYGPNGKDDFGSYHTKTRGSFEVTL